MTTLTRWPDETEDKPIPGPWEVRHVTENWAVICPVGYVTRICELSTENTLSPRDLANARLIAAAPDMLAALNGLFEHCAMVHKHWGDGNNQKEANAAIEAARAAIAAATGETA